MDFRFGFWTRTSQINLNNQLLENHKKNIIGIIDEGILYIHDGTSNRLFYYALKPIGKIK